MKNGKLRRQIAWEAARLLFGNQEVEIHRARIKAARRLCRGRVRPQDMPDDVDIRQQVKVLINGHGGTEAGEAESAAADLDAFEVYEELLLPLEHVKQNTVTHPEGDVLYHSLQVFQLARDELPYDEEFLLAALLHDVGKAINIRDHVSAGLEALHRRVTDRTYWLIEHHQEGMATLQGTLGTRARRRLARDESFEELLLLAECDRQARCRGIHVPDVSDALGYIRGLSISWD